MLDFRVGADKRVLASVLAQLLESTPTHSTAEHELVCGASLRKSAGDSIACAWRLGESGSGQAPGTLFFAGSRGPTGGGTKRRPIGRQRRGSDPEGTKSTRRELTRASKVFLTSRSLASPSLSPLSPSLFLFSIHPFFPLPPPHSPSLSVLILFYCPRYILPILFFLKGKNCN